jgi:hypothetical protein
MERLVRIVVLAIFAVIGLHILWSLIMPWLPELAVIVSVLVLVRLWLWYRTRW